MEKKDYSALNRQGFFPAPQETEEEFSRRVSFLQMSFFSEKKIPLEDWEGVYSLITPLFDIKPDWIRGSYSDKGLSFWQGGAIWIEEKEGIVFPRIQLRMRLRKGKILGLYSKEEILAHEAVHAVRMSFDEPRFEEVLAYKTSRGLRRVLGPFLRRTEEAYLLILLLFLVVGAGCFFHGEKGSVFLLVAFLGYGSLRLFWAQRILSCCIKHVEPLLQKPAFGYAVALRLSDKEISLFAKSSREKIRSYVLENQEELRWKILYQEYFIPFEEL